MVLDAPGGRVGEPKIPAGIGRERERERGEETATLRSCQSQPAHQKSIKIIRRRGRRKLISIWNTNVNTCGVDEFPFDSGRRPVGFGSVRIPHVSFPNNEEW